MKKLATSDQYDKLRLARFAKDGLTKRVYDNLSKNGWSAANNWPSGLELTRKCVYDESAIFRDGVIRAYSHVAAQGFDAGTQMLSNVGMYANRLYEDAAWALRGKRIVRFARVGIRGDRVQGIVYSFKWFSAPLEATSDGDFRFTVRIARLGDSFRKTIRLSECVPPNIVGSSLVYSRIIELKKNVDPKQSEYDRGYLLALEAALAAFRADYPGIATTGA